MISVYISLATNYKILAFIVHENIQTHSGNFIYNVLRLILQFWTVYKLLQVNAKLFIIIVLKQSIITISYMKN